MSQRVGSAALRDAVERLVSALNQPTHKAGAVAKNHTKAIKRTKARPIRSALKNSPQVIRAAGICGAVEQTIGCQYQRGLGIGPLGQGRVEAEIVEHLKILQCRLKPENLSWRGAAARKSAIQPTGWAEEQSTLQWITQGALETQQDLVTRAIRLDLEDCADSVGAAGDRSPVQSSIWARDERRLGNRSIVGESAELIKLAVTRAVSVNFEQDALTVRSTERHGPIKRAIGTQHKGPLKGFPELSWKRVQHLKVGAIRGYLEDAPDAIGARADGALQVALWTQCERGKA